MRYLGDLNRALALALIALFVFSGVTPVHAHRHLETTRQLKDGVATAFPSSIDLDVDFKPEQLTLRANGYDKTISIRFGNASHSLVSFKARSDGPGILITRDIDHDGDVDLVWTGRSDRNSAVVLLNNGDGNFVEATDNSGFASELDGLFGSIDPSGTAKLKRGRKSASLTSTSLQPVGLSLPTRFESIAVRDVPVAIESPFIQSVFAIHIRKRGPPVFLS